MPTLIERMSQDVDVLNSMVIYKMYDEFGDKVLDAYIQAQHLIVDMSISDQCHTINFGNINKFYALLNDRDDVYILICANNKTIGADKKLPEDMNIEMYDGRGEVIGVLDFYRR